MRKPFIVAGVASAVLFSGAVLATAADAGEAPGTPAGAGLDDKRGHRGYTPHQPVVDDRPPASQAPAAPGRAARPRMVLRAGRMSAARAGGSSADMSARPLPSVQKNVLALVNERRRRAGCGPLALDRRLIDAANEHATDMARHGYFAHASRNGDDPGDRVRDAGFRWRWYGENIARGAGSPGQVVRDWMASPEHRDNILDCRLREMGIGLAVSPRRGPYWVQDFATS